jgi:hypothetical protein
VSNVTLAEVCPSIRDNAKTFAPQLIAIEAQECPRSWRDPLHIRPLHCSGEPSAIGLRTRQIGAVTEHEIVGAALSTLHG